MNNIINLEFKKINKTLQKIENVLEPRKINKFEKNFWKTINKKPIGAKKFG